MTATAVPIHVTQLKSVMKSESKHREGVREAFEPATRRLSLTGTATPDRRAQAARTGDRAPCP